MDEHKITVKERLTNLLASHVVAGILGYILMYFKPEIANQIVVIAIVISGRSMMKVWTEGKSNVQSKVESNKN